MRHDADRCSIRKTLLQVCREDTDSDGSRDEEKENEAEEAHVRKAQISGATWVHNPESETYDNDEQRTKDEGKAREAEDEGECLDMGDWVANAEHHRVTSVLGRIMNVLSRTSRHKRAGAIFEHGYAEADGQPLVQIPIKTVLASIRIQRFPHPNDSKKIDCSVHVASSEDKKWSKWVLHVRVPDA